MANEIKIKTGKSGDEGSEAGVGLEGAELAALVIVFQWVDRSSGHRNRSRGQFMNGIAQEDGQGTEKGPPLETEQPAAVRRDFDGFSRCSGPLGIEVYCHEE